jgi:hypothetical protein
MRENWPVPQQTREAIMEELCEVLEAPASDVRVVLAAARTVLAAERANIRALVAEGRKPA